jgi:hypothetical protein
MLLTGHLSEYPLPILVEIFLQRKETGKLEVACPIASGYFYFSGGELVDATMGKLRGIDAVNFAENLREADFKFSPLGRAEYAQAVWSQAFAKTGGSVGYTRAARAYLRTIAKKTASALLSAFPLVFKTGRSVGAARAYLRAIAKKTASALLSAFPLVFKSLGSKLMILASPLNRAGAGSRQWVPVAWVLLLAAFVVSTHPVKFFENSSPSLTPPSTDGGGEISLDKANKNQVSLKEMLEPAVTSTGAEKNHPETSRHAGEEKDNSRRKIEPAQKSRPSSLMRENRITKKTESSAAGTQTVAVALRIQNGRVSEAVVLRHRQGLEAFEASALRIARQRRYDPSTQGNQTILVKVDQPQ